MKKHFTATLYLLKELKTLLVFHQKLQKWLPPGGHLELDELPSEAALREAREETGLDAEIIDQPPVTIDRWNARSFPSPFLCLLEEIPPWGDEPAHQHMDLIYVGRVVGDTTPKPSDGIADARWFSLEEIDALEDDVEIYVETRQVIKAIFRRFSQTSPV